MNMDDREPKGKVNVELVEAFKRKGFHRIEQQYYLALLRQEILESMIKKK
ncbi:hypothetical protein [Bacillus altitudinis]